MKSLQEKFFNRSPLYPAMYRPMMDRLTRVGDVSKSTGKDDEQFDRGKAFGSMYECYIYAAIVGIKAGYCLKFGDSKPGPKFLQIKDWKHENSVQYLYMSLLALADFPFTAIENLTEEDAAEKAGELVDMLEGYTKGGLELMAAKINETPHFFEIAGNVVSFVQTIKPFTN
jgi:hypothetical protein